MNEVKKLLLSLLCLSILSSCGNGKSGEETDDGGSDTSHVVDQTQMVSAQNIFNSVPAPAEVSEMIERTNLDYDGTVLNNPDNYKKYTTDDYKALNLGVYGTDLSYTSVFDQSQESLVYLTCVNQACRSLGISGVFDQKTFDRIDANKQNKDSLLQIISKSFWAADKFLKENKRANTSTLMVAGGWIEGIYLAANIAKLSNDKRIIQKIIAQKNSLKDLITLLESSKLSPDVAFICENLKQISPLFDDATATPTEVKKDEKETVATPNPFIKSLDEKITPLRKKVTMN
ncbi:MAG TPA: hypothetical protein VNX68_18985 [Nitrosopumilaceae archaeon]|jgi:hypothetical protein|nr:hypothetical protein [Nitrosopumilaceae archaeon]